jgi:ribulose-phosphate 3-epimerase
LMMKIAPSLLAADFANLGRDIRAADEAGADMLHFDVMDGRFVPNISLGPPIVAAARPHSRLFFDVHLMIEDPERFIDEFARAGANGLTIQVEAVHHLFRAVDQIHRAGARAGVAICPATPLAAIAEILSVVDLLLIMTVDPGFGGQAYIPTMTDRIKRAAEMARRAGSSAQIEVDGGITTETIPLAAAAGATVFVAGSAVFKAGVPIAEAIRDLRTAAVSGKASAASTADSACGAPVERGDS